MSTAIETISYQNILRRKTAYAPMSAAQDARQSPSPLKIQNTDFADRKSQYISTYKTAFSAAC
jgi:hypothetical protein